MSNASTGKTRAIGPMPPNTPLPDTPKYHRTFSYETIMVGNVLLDMGFLYIVSDGRVWFLEDVAR